MEYGIGLVMPVDEGGVFTSEVPDYEGMQIFDANRYVVADLREQGGPIARRAPEIRAVLVREKSYVHSYPHCWRCRKPLMYLSLIHI